VLSSCTTFDYATYTPASTSLTLAADIQPIFGASCALGGCHLTGSSPQHPFLGPSGSTATVAEITALKAELASASTEATSSKFVVAGDPQNSYLMLKLDQNPAGCSACGTLCGVRMPFGGQLEAASLGKIRDWIKSGAN
jgi:hypothetical protein